ncbi:MAG: hypothetical protein KIT84_05835 [Labilithrix sp.]|nr:hypothetical protein [Labilithrix sp.]MCW5810510.1 hypothetical protein [Labilithrix sp.]
MFALVACAAVGAFAACSFPEVVFDDGAPEAGPDGRIDDIDAAATDGGVDATDAVSDAGDGGRVRPDDVDPEGGTRDAAVRDDASVRLDGGPDGSGCAVACDCDGDLSLNRSCELPPDERPDCDDFDPLVYPGQDFVASPWDPQSSHPTPNDWNCDGKVTKQFDYGIKCSLTDCTEGFAIDVPCGATGTYNICKPALNVLGLVTLCSVGSTEQRIQGCR